MASLATHIHDEALMNGLVDAIAPALQIGHLQIDLILFAIQIAQARIVEAWRPGAAGHERVHLGEVALGNGLAQVVEGLRAGQVVAEALHVVARHYLLVHVVEELAAAILGHNAAIGGLEGVDQMPMPVVKIDAQILAEIPQAMLRLQIGGRIVPGYDDGHARAGLHHKGLLAQLTEHLRVDEAIGERLGERGQIQSLGVGPMQQCDRECIVEHHGIDTIASIDRHALQIVDAAHVHKDVDEAASDASVLRYEQRELLLAAQRHGYAQIRDRDLSDGHTLLHLLADTALHLVADRPVAIGQIAIGHIEHRHLLALVHEDGLGGVLEQQQ